MRSWPPGSTSSSGRWTCARRGCPAPCRSCACGPIWICCKSETAAPSPKGPHRTIHQARPIPAPTAPAAPAAPAVPADPAARAAPTVRGGPGPAPRPGPDAGPSLAALVTITIPLATQQGRSEAPGDAGGYGPLDGDDARDLVAAAARHPSTRWCVTALNPDGTAAAHGCIPGRHPPRDAGPPGTGPPLTGPPSLGPPGILATPLTPITRGPCDHAHAQAGYHPSRTLVHLIRARNATCTAPGCSRPAVRCDLDHTTAYDKGGRTCECNLAPLVGIITAASKARDGNSNNLAQAS